MISIITAIHNGLAINKLFLHYLEKHTYFPYELIIVDNNSTDGSCEFFEQSGAKIIKNSSNYSYSFCQNQGIKAAKYDVLAFLNNDIVVSPNWDKRLLEVADSNGLDVITPCGLERVENEMETRKLRRRWKRIKNFMLWKRSFFNFRLIHYLMYGNWEKFCEERYGTFKTQIREGIVGHTVMMRRSAIEKIGMWDERLQHADFDLFLRAKKRSLEQGDIKPVHIALGVFVHHFIRITVRSKPLPFKDKDKLISLEDKWTESELKKYLKNIPLN